MGNYVMIDRSIVVEKFLTEKKLNINVKPLALSLCPKCKT